MKNFSILVVNPLGKKERIQRSGLSEDSIIRDLSQQGFLILEVKQANWNETEARPQKFPFVVVLEFTQTLDLLLQSGLTFKQAIKVAKSVLAVSKSLPLIELLDSNLDKGRSIYETLIPYRESFPSLYLGLINIGEKTGNLSPIFQRLTQFLSQQKLIQDKVSNALVYPSLVLGLAVLGVILLSVVVFPSLTEIVTGLNKVASETFLKNIQGIQTFLAFLGVFFLLFILGGIGFSLMLKKQPSLHFQWHRFLWKVPLLHNLIETYNSLSLAFSMETLVASGFTIEASLQETASTFSNPFVRSLISKVREDVLKGSSLSAAFRKQGEFSERWITWINVGEGANNLAGVFTQLREYYQQGMENLSARLMNLLEPGMIILVGVLIIFLITNFITPIFSLLGSVV